MSELKQETGYAAAKNVSAKPLNGTIPGTGRVMDWSKGDLKSLFVEPAAKAPSLKQAGPTAAKPENEQPKAQKEEPTAKAASNDRQAQGNNQPENNQPDNNLDDDRNDLAQAKPAPAPETTKLKTPVTIPAQFAPVMAAGTLTALQQEAAADSNSTGLSTDMQDKAEFQLGTSSRAAMVARFNQAEQERHAEADAKASSSADMIEQYYAQQQRQEFMRSMEYSVAMHTVNTTMRRQEQEMTVLRNDVRVLAAQKAESDQRLETMGQQIEVKEERVEKLEEAAKLDEQLKVDGQAANDADATQAALDEQIRQMPTIKTFKGDKGDYFQTIENGEEVTYRMAAGGQPEKITKEELESDASATCNIPLSTYLKKMPDGSVEFIDAYGRKLGQDKVDKLNEFMEKTEKTGADLGDMDDFEKSKAAADKHRDEVLIPAYEQATATEQKLWKSLDDLKIPREDAKNIQKYLQDEKQGLADLRAEYEKEKAANKLTTQQLADKEAELKAMESDYEKSKEFKKRLENGEFKNEAEMIKAMPETMKAAYESNRNDAKATAQNKAAPVAQQTASSPENTSRANGSASEPTVTASTTLGPPFAAAASGAPATPASPEPETPAPEVVASNQQKYNQSGIRP